MGGESIIAEDGGGLGGFAQAERRRSGTYSRRLVQGHG